MFGKSAPSPTEAQPERNARVTHTPGAYPPLSPRNDLRPRQPATPVVGLSTDRPQPNPSPAPLETAMPNAAEPTSTAQQEPASRLIVGPDVKLKGAEIHDCDTLVVEGRVEATMDSRVLRIAERGAFSGKVGIDVAEIHGEFEGELTARKQLLIHAGGRVRGTIRYGSLLVEAGGQVSGDVQALADTSSKPIAASPLVNSEKEVERNSNVKALISSVA